MQRTDAPRLQVFTPEVAKVEGDNDGSLTVDSGGQHMAILFIVCHPRNQCLVTADPRLAEMGAQFSFEIGRQRTRPPELRFQRTGCLTNDLLRSLRLIKPRLFCEAQEGVTEGEVGEDARVQDDERYARHFWSGISTRSYRPS